MPVSVTWISTWGRVGFQVHVGIGFVKSDIFHFDGQLPPSGMASRALTQRFSRTW